MRKNIIKDKSFEFALKVILFSDKLIEKKRYVLSRQILRSGTSIGANIREAQQAESKRDFIHKLRIALKETEETEYWMLLCKEAYSEQDAEVLLCETEEIKKLLISIILKANDNLRIWGQQK